MWLSNSDRPLQLEDGEAKGKRLSGDGGRRRRRCESDFGADCSVEAAQRGEPRSRFGICTQETRHLAECPTRIAGSRSASRPYSCRAPATPPQPPPPSGVHDIRSFAAEKKPKTVNEKVAVIGYYLAQLAPEGERRDYLIADDIKAYFIQADLQLPTAPPNVTLINAKNAGYFNASDRGQYKLNAVGHNLVAHKLPSGEAGEAKRRAAPRKPRKKATTRKKAGK